jgi:hypothetical protein
MSAAGCPASVPAQTTSKYRPDHAGRYSAPSRLPPRYSCAVRGQEFFKGKNLNHFSTLRLAPPILRALASEGDAGQFIACDRDFHEAIVHAADNQILTDLYSSLRDHQLRMGIATILHWDRFTNDHIAFQVWAVLYFTTPFLVLGVWLANRRVASAPPALGEVMLLARARLTAGVIGVVAVVLALVLFAWPEQLLEFWPWTLTPLTARVMAAILLLGSVGIGIARNPRWQSVRLAVQVFWVMLGLIAIASVVAWSDLDLSKALTWLFAAALAAVLTASVVLYRSMENRVGTLPPTK